jgi:hypothetical protein
MKNKLSFLKIGVIFSLFLLVIPSVGDIDRLMGAGTGTETGTYVLVTLRNGEVKKWEQDSFKIKWIFPVTFLEDETCVNKTFNKEDIKDIFPISRSWNNCEKKEDWLFEVDFHDGDYAQGYVMSQCKIKEKDDAKVKNIAAETEISGIAAGSGKEETIDYKDIRKISFVKANR